MTVRVFLTWLLFIAAETVHGALRGLFLVPVVGEHRAGQLGVGIGSCIALAVAWASVRWIGRRPAVGWLQIGAVWTALTLIFEVGLGRALGFGWDRIAADYDLTRGGLMIFGVAVVFVAPYLAARCRGMAGAGS